VSTAVLSDLPALGAEHGVPPAVTGGKTSPRLLVIDVQLVIHHGVRQFAQQCGAIGEVATARSGREAITVARQFRPDVALIDTWLPDMLLNEAVRGIRAASPRTRIIVYAPRVTPSLREAAVGLDVDGVLGKDATAESFAEVVCGVASGKPCAPSVDSDLLDHMAKKLGCQPLTAREYEILRWVARGESNAGIAREVFLAPTTVKSYLQNALRKLGARNRAEAVFMLSELRLL
jgi:two-component system nitrate/nitrite response regulator NarL